MKIQNHEGGFVVGEIDIDDVLAANIVSIARDLLNGDACIANLAEAVHCAGLINNRVLRENS